nr:pepsin/retropepsin-like aspartic protease family protein [Allomuricauda sp.]
MKKIIRLLIFLCFSHSIYAQIAKIPFKKMGKGMAIQIAINDAEKAWMVFDTGATMMAIDSTYATQIGLKVDYTNNFGGASGSKKLSFSNRNQVHIAPKHSLENITVVMPNLSALKTDLKENVVGIIGYNILMNYKVLIDYKSQTIALYKFEDELSVNDYKELDFTFDNNITIPQFDIEIELSKNEKIRGKVLFDTGAALSLMLNVPFIEENGIETKLKSIQVLEKETKSLNGNFKADKGELNGLTINGYSFRNVEIFLPSKNLKSGVSAMNGYLGILGNEIIKQFHWIIDYKAMKLYMKPNDLYTSDI